MSRARVPATAQPQRSPARSVSRPHDAHEREADRAANAVARGASVAGWSFSAVSSTAPAPVQRDEVTQKIDEEKKTEVMTSEVKTKAIEVLRATPVGKALEKKVLDDPRVKAITKAATSPAGLAVAGAAIAGGVGALAATGTELPFQPPAIPLDKITPGLSAQLTYKGPVNAPTSAGLVLTYSAPGPEAKGAKQTATELQREENARLRAADDAFRGSMKFAPGTKEAADDEAMQRFIRSRIGKLPGFDSPLIPIPVAPRPEPQDAPVQRSASAVTSDPAGASYDTGVVDDALATPGSALEAPTRRYMEARFGHDFSGVRVHADSASAASALALDAAAYTTGRDIVFAPGRYDPASAGGRRLLAHELAHVVQQSHGQTAVQRCGAPGCPSGTCGCQIPEFDKDGEAAGPPADGGTPVLADGGAAVPMDGGPPASAPTVATAMKNSCGGSSLAATVTPTAKGVTPKPGGSFGITSKLAAGFEFGACKTASDWRFHLTSLTMPVASAVQDLGWTERTHVADANDPEIKASTYAAVARDLSPTAAVKQTATCAGVGYTQDVKDYSRRKTYWNRPVVIEHEAFHLKDWVKRYRVELTLAEQQIWGHSLPLASAKTEAEAVAAARTALIDLMIAAYNPRACAAFAAASEARAYTDGAPTYQKLVDAIEARAKQAGWP